MFKKLFTPFAFISIAFNANATSIEENPSFITACPHVQETSLVKITNPFPYPNVTNSYDFYTFDIIGKITHEITAPIISNLILGAGVRSLPNIFSISSHGGDLTAGIGLANAIGQMPKNTETISITNSVASSAASVIAFSVDTAYAAENASFLIHASWSEVSGGYNHRDANQLLKSSNFYDNILRKAYEKSNPEIGESCLNYLTNGDDHVMNAITAAKLGFIDYVIVDEKTAYKTAKLAPQIE